MTTIKKDVRAEEIRLQSATHVLFVEGKDDNAIDPQVLKEFLGSKIGIEALGPSFYVHSAAEALHKHHPDYYFLIDRDHHYDDAFVEKCWRNFPDPKTPNLLVWRRKEIENYFIDPIYAAKSKYLSVSAETLRNRIKKLCMQRLYLDTANYVIVSIREELKSNWIEIFKNPSDFKTKDDAIEQLSQAPEFSAFKGSVTKKVQKRQLLLRFERYLSDMTGGLDDLEFGTGQRLNLLNGKKIFSSIGSQCFVVKDISGTAISGKEKISEIAKNLMRLPLTDQPSDFQQLYSLISDRVKSTNN